MLRFRAVAQKHYRPPFSAKRNIFTGIGRPSNAHTPLLRPLCRSTLHQRYNASLNYVPAASFHATRRNEGLPLVPILASVLKVSCGEYSMLCITLTHSPSGILSIGDCTNGWPNYPIFRTFPTHKERSRSQDSAHGRHAG